jgi:hypothetical protein
MMYDAKTSWRQGEVTTSQQRRPLAFLLVFLYSFWSLVICFFHPKHDLQLELPLRYSVLLPRM